MKQTVFVLAASVMLTTAATAGGIAFSLPNLQFPATDTFTVGKDCALPDVESHLCEAEQ